MKDNDKKILVYYIDVSQIDQDDQKDYINRITKNISIETMNNIGEVLIIPIYGQTRIECINPVYIKDNQLIKKHERLMAELHESLDNYINNTKKE